MPEEPGSMQIDWAERARSLLAVRGAAWQVVRAFRPVADMWERGQPVASAPDLARAIRLLELELREIWPEPERTDHE
jgi:hypothetical protein